MTGCCSDLTSHLPRCVACCVYSNSSSTAALDDDSSETKQGRDASLNEWVPAASLVLKRVVMFVCFLFNPLAFAFFFNGRGWGVTGTTPMVHKVLY